MSISQKFTVDTARPAGPNSNGFVIDQFSDAPVVVQAVVNGLINHSLQVTNDNPFAPGGVVTWFDHSNPATVNATGNYRETIQSAPTAVRVVRLSGAGSVDVTVSQVISAS